MIRFQAAEEASDDKLSKADKKTVQTKCAEEMKWLDANNTAEKEEFEDHLKDLQQVCSPLMSKLHGQGQGGAQGSQGAGKRQGPTVEEVD